ncbi:hypothetical protein N7528_001407 [Penicillium herquei]|nr:hypothetical protein N7528_001407 [Penicillium herquei]
MKNSYLTGLLFALIGIASANKQDQNCSDTVQCLSVMPDFHMRDMSSSYGNCIEGCMGDVRDCCKQPCANLVSCSTNFSNCHLKCRSNVVPTHFQCVDNCMVVWNNCMAEPVAQIDDEPNNHMDHCRTDYRNCRRACHQE